MSISSHLFQRVASFLLEIRSRRFYGFRLRFSSLSESGFIPTLLREQFSNNTCDCCSHLFQRVASFLLSINFVTKKWFVRSSHLFQRVASFLHYVVAATDKLLIYLFSSLSESGFIPTSIQWPEINDQQSWFSSLSESGFIPTPQGIKVTALGGHPLVLISFREWLHSYNSQNRKWYPKASK